MIREPLPATVSIVDAAGRPNRAFAEWLSKTVEAQVTDILAVQALAEAAQTSADSAATAASDAQSAADAAQAAVDAIVIPPTSTRTVTASTVLTSDDFSVLVDAGAGPVTITLFPAAAAQNAVTVQKVDVTANAVDVQPGGSDNLNGSGSAISLTAQFQKLNLTSDTNSDWYA